MKILIIEDDADLREIISASLRKDRYVVETAATCREAREKVGVYEYDCILLDIMLPDGSGLNVLRYIQGQSKPAPVIVISAKDSIDDKVSGLELGADDYLPKPFHLAELHARIKSVLRRHSEVRTSRIQLGNVALDNASFEVEVAGRRVEMNRKEYDILAYFMARVGRLVPKQTLAEGVWGDYIDMADNYDFVYAQMKNLRKKLKAAEADIEIQTVYGVGYKLIQLCD